MALQPFRDEQLNYFKFAFAVLNEFPKALRQTFRSRWDRSFGHLPGYQPWDDSIAVRNLFLSTEGDSKGHHRTLGDLYVKPHKLPHGTFHRSVVSPGGNTAETFALAIDQLRLLRNSLCHSTSSEINKPTFDKYMQHAKDAFKALRVKTDPIDAIGGLTESDFPTEEVRKLEQGIKEETRAYIKFSRGRELRYRRVKSANNCNKGESGRHCK
ncbi:hypothetical protein OS493_020222 [Desmophyllum pertusum]|uniref:DZIP3-like HEPN domain-containing protein n=1 Tax=Desmophyllum pertusum TaxID=174260 RepID=A0A9X0D3S4_9CNID|nr:hypothetical protein OS493_020222 [Desmophyllum pertusum]